MTDEQPGWVSVAAVAWVIDHAPVPAELAWTLLVIARRCDEHGRGSYQRIGTIAEKTGKSEKQARRDVHRLLDLGLIMLGDQALVDHLPAGQRPTVYDVPLYVRGPKPLRESRNPTGVNRKTTPMDGTPPSEGSPPTHGRPTPPIDTGPTPPMEGSQTKPLKNPVEQPSLSGLAAAEGQPAEDRERDRDELDPTTQIKIGLLLDHGAHDHAEAVALLAEIERGKKYGLGWWRKLAGNGDLAARIVDVRDRLAIVADQTLFVPVDREPVATHDYEDTAEGCAVCSLPRTNRRHRPKAA